MREGSVIDADLAQDFPTLAVLFATQEVGGRAYRRAAKERLGRLSDRIGGDLAAAMRQQAVPGAFRAFARQIGLDPDADGLPLERALTARIRAGRFVSGGALEDPCTVAMLETGVPVWVLDEQRLSGPLGIGPVREADPQAATAVGPQPDRLAVWDECRPLVALLGGPDGRATDVVPQRTTERVRLFALRVDGVPDAAVREALWTAAQLTGPGR